jgi:outer membrane protein OmpA-like peptidoglycan-associated protein
VGQSEWRVGLVVVVRGRVSKMPNQHLMGGVAGKRDFYFDVTGGSQTVVYAAALPACGGELELRGKVLEVRGGSKRPGEASKVGSSYSELHVDVDDARCIDDEIVTKAQVTFEVRPLGGPGSMGPTELSAASDPALHEIVRWLADHPDVTKLAIEGHVNGLKMSSTPNARWGAQLAGQVAQWLVKHGVDCHRLEVVGRLDPDPKSPAERIRFRVHAGAAREPGDVVADACKP